MKYCLVYSGDKEINKDNIDAVGFYQWSNAMKGSIISSKELLEDFKDRAYDLLHFQLNRENVKTIIELRKKLGENSHTKILVSMDIPPTYWKTEFKNIEDLVAAAVAADFITATEHVITIRLQELCTKKIFSIPYPADLQKIRNYKKTTKKKVLTVLQDASSNQSRVFKTFGFKFLRKLLFIYKKLPLRLFREIFGIDLQFMFYLDQDASVTLKELQRNKIKRTPLKTEIVISESELCAKLSESRLILAMYEDPSFGKLVVYAAALGSMVIGHGLTDATRRCYGVTSHKIDDKTNFIKSFWWNLVERDSNKHLPIVAQNKVEYYNFSNLRKRLLDFLYDQSQDNRFIYSNFRENKRTENINYFDNINFVSGMQKISYDLYECVLVCLLKNGEEYIDTFLDHYRSMGITHFFFIDNNSSDRTVKMLSGQQDITIYSTDLNFGFFECDIRRVIIEEHCRGRWCLCVDIDELFDFPFSNMISLQLFLKYHYEHNFTAVTAHMLDMFTDRGFNFKNEDHSIKKDHRNLYEYYDISNIKHRDYFKEFHGYNNHNTTLDNSLKYSYGGIRGKYFKSGHSNYLLIKHPLQFIDGILDPVSHPHFCNNAHISDITGIIRHYKFTHSFKDRIIGFFESKSSSYYHNEEYNAYYKALKNKDSFDLYSVNSEKFVHINQLLEADFIKTSEHYKNWIKKTMAIRKNATKNVH